MKNFQSFVETACSIQYIKNDSFVTGARRGHSVESGTPGGRGAGADHSRRFLDVIVTEGRRIQAREDQERGRCLRSEIAIKRQATRVVALTCLASELSVQLRASVPCWCKARNLVPSAVDSAELLGDGQNSDKAKKQHLDLPTFRFWYCTATYRIPPPSINQSSSHHNFASLASRRVRNHVQGWSAFVLLRSQHQPIKGEYPSSWICKASCATLPKMCGGAH